VAFLTTSVAYSLHIRHLDARVYYCTFKLRNYRRHYRLCLFVCRQGQFGMPELGSANGGAMLADGGTVDY